MENTLIIEKAYELAEAIKDSELYQNYIRYEQLILEDVELQLLLKDFQNKKQQFEEATQYGNYYPGLDDIKSNYQHIKIKLMSHELFKKFKESEKQLDLIVYQIESSLKSIVNIKDKHGKSKIKFL